MRPGERRQRSGDSHDLVWIDQQIQNLVPWATWRLDGEATTEALDHPFDHPDDPSVSVWSRLDRRGVQREQARSVNEVWLMGTPSPNRYVDITDMLDRKLAALRAHQSQTAHRNTLEEDVRERLVPNSQAAGLPPGRLAEAFQVVTIE